MRRFTFAILAFLATSLVPTSVQGHAGCEFASLHSFGAALEYAGFDGDRGWYRSEYAAALSGRNWQARLGEGRRVWLADRRWAGLEPVRTSVARQDLPAVSVPEPTTWLIMLTGLLGLGFVAYRRREETLA